MDPRIGQLNNGKYYAFVNGFNAEPFVGSVEDVEVALGLREQSSKIEPTKPSSTEKTFNVRLTFEYPSWDEKEGILYPGIIASGKADANSQARKRAREDGHLGGGRGRVCFTAEEA